MTSSTATPLYCTVGLSVHLTVCLCPQHKHAFSGSGANRHTRPSNPRCHHHLVIVFILVDLAVFDGLTFLMLNVMHHLLKPVATKRKKRQQSNLIISSLVRRALLSLPQLDASLALGVNRKLPYPSFSRASLFLSYHEDYNASISTDSFFVRSKMNRQNKDYNRLWTKTTSRSTYISLARQIGMTYRPTHR